MKNFFNVIFICVFSIGLFGQSTQDNSKSNNSDKVYKIGDYAHGGIVFYVDETGKHGLVCAKNDQSEASPWNRQKITRRNDRLSDNLFTNTTIFGKRSKEKRNQRHNFANRICDRLKIKEDGKTFKDWYLPSKEELNLLYQSRDIINTSALKNEGRKFSENYYWSSTEFDFTSAWVQYFFNGKQSHHYKNYEYSVRAIRAF